LENHDAEIEFEGETVCPVARVLILRLQGGVRWTTVRYDEAMKKPVLSDEFWVADAVATESGALAQPATQIRRAVLAVRIFSTLRLNRVSFSSHVHSRG